MMSTEPLLAMIRGVTRLVERSDLSEAAILTQASALMGTLVQTDDWLAPAMAVPHPDYYRQYLLYGDPLDRYSLVSFVWGPGQQTPVHDHTVWGVIGMLRGAEKDQPYRHTPDGLQPHGAPALLEPGTVACVSPSVGDIHRVSNAFDDQVSISIHLYGGNIGRIERSVYDPLTGASKPFVSGYSNAMLPNLWAKAD